MARSKPPRPTAARRDPAYLAQSAYLAQFADTPVRIAELPVTLTAQKIELLRRLRRDIYGDDDAAALRDIFLTW